MLIGGSHVVQYWPAFESLGKKYHWKITVLNRDACQFYYATEGKPVADHNTELCIAWNHNALDYIIDHKPNLVVTLGTTFRGGTEHVDPNMETLWAKLNESGIPLLLVRDNPTLSFNPTECVESKPIADCTLPSSTYSPSITNNGIANLKSGNTFVDNSIVLTDKGVFTPVIGNMYVWRDAGHITSYYAKTTDLFFEKYLRESHPDLFDGQSSRRGDS